MSSDRDQGFFADGVTEDLITALSRVRELLVIPRTSTSAYKEHETPIGKVASELGVRYVLGGSVRVASNKVRVTAQLIDGVTGGHVWAGNFDGKLDDIFALQDEITRNIVLALQIKLTSGEAVRLWEGQTRNLRAWEKMALARDKFSRFDVASNRDAQRLLKESLQIDPNYTGAMLQLGMTYYWEGRYITSADKENCAQLIGQQVDNILRVDPDMGSDIHVEGLHCLIAGPTRGGDSFMSESSRNRTWRFLEHRRILATAFIYNEDSDKAVALLRTAMRLSPYIPPWHTYYFVLANLWNGDLATAREAAESYLRQEPDEPYGYVNLALVYGFDRREADASRVISALRKKTPEFGIKDVLFSQCYRQREKLDRVVEVLRRAGLPESFLDAPVQQVVAMLPAAATIAMSPLRVLVVWKRCARVSSGCGDRHLGILDANGRHWHLGAAVSQEGPAVGRRVTLLSPLCPDRCDERFDADDVHHPR